ncbi:COG0388 Predicted amidohydrolase [Candidatus Nanopelagicaceae bacterium]
MRAALVSLDITWNNKEVNKKSCSQILARIAAHQVDLVIFPEMTLTGFNMKPTETGEELANSNTISFFKSEAVTNKIGIVFGVVIKKDLKFFNCAVFIDEQGQILTSYSKIHLFSHSEENKFFQGGELLSVASFKNYKIGLTICYDLRFPELYSSLSQYSDIVINIANWPAKRDLHWETFLRARAIENQTTIIGVNRSGTDQGGEMFSGESKVIYPNGGVVDPYYFGREFEIYNIDIEEAAESVRHFNTVKDKKSELYISWNQEMYSVLNKVKKS